MAATSIIHVNTWITSHLPTQEGWKAELADPLWTVYQKIVSYQPGKVCRLKMDINQWATLPSGPSRYTLTAHTAYYPNWFKIYTQKIQTDTCAEVSTCGKLHTLLCAANHHGLTNLTEVTTDALELGRRQFDDAAVVSLLQTSRQNPQQSTTQ